MDDQHSKIQEKTQARTTDRDTDKDHQTSNSNDRQRSGDNAPRGMAGKSDDEGNAGDLAAAVGDTVNQATTMMRNVGEQAWSAATNAAANAGSTATDLARQARDQVGALNGPAGRAGEYLSRNVNAYPLAALMIAGAVGYGLGYLLHNSWQSDDSQGGSRSQKNDGGSK